MRTPLSLSSPFIRTLRPHKNIPYQAFRHSSCKMSTPSNPVFSAGYDPEQGTRDLAPLLRENGGKWSVIESGKGVERGFKFKTFKKTWVCISHFLLSLSPGSVRSLVLGIMMEENQMPCLEGRGVCMDLRKGILMSISGKYQRAKLMISGYRNS